VNLEDAGRKVRLLFEGSLSHRDGVSCALFMKSNQEFVGKEKR
jgi:hypothetical protein